MVYENSHEQNCKTIVRQIFLSTLFLSCTNLFVLKAGIFLYFVADFFLKCSNNYSGTIYLSKKKVYSNKFQIFFTNPYHFSLFAYLKIKVHLKLRHKSLNCYFKIHIYIFTYIQNIYIYVVFLKYCSQQCSTKIWS